MVSGGGEDNENIYQTAIRELKDVFVVPEYSSAINIGNRQIEMSNEHKTMQWCNYEEAMTKLKYDSNKTALWELNERLKNSL